MYMHLTFIAVLVGFHVFATTVVAKEAKPVSTAPAPKSDGAEGSSGPWPATVAGFTAPAPGEHPRLLFRKSDLATLKKRAETPEGKAIIARLKVTLGGGDFFPKENNPMTSAYGRGGGPKKWDAKPGAYSISHAAGYGLLYQLTGDKSYADLGKESFEKAFEGLRDRDGEARYSFRVPGGALRAGPSLGWYALGYDLCYDGWDEAFRKKVALAIQNYNEGANMSMPELAAGKRHMPASNHWGPQVGGGAMALLAIQGDPGVDNKKVESMLAVNEKAMIRHLTEGFGDHGFFPEGDGTGAIASDTVFATGLQAWRVAGGKDFISPRPNASWMTMKWVMGCIVKDGGGKPAYHVRGAYPHNYFAREELSGSGHFVQGFGCVADEYKPALLWFYKRTYKDADEKAKGPFDTVSEYPHRSILALVNWPFEMAEKNPGEVLPRAIEDKKWGYYCLRERWQDGNDVVISMLLRNTRGFHGADAGTQMTADGKTGALPFHIHGSQKSFKSFPAGGVVTSSAGSIGADFSGASGARALIVCVGGATSNSPWTAQSVSAGGNTFKVVAIGGNVTPKADGDKLVIGKQVVSVVGGEVQFEVTK